MKLFILVPLIMAAVVPMAAAAPISISPIMTGSHTSDEFAESRYPNTPIWIDFEISVDAGYYSPAFAIYELPASESPVVDAVLNLVVDTTNTISFTIAVYDVSDISALQSPGPWASLTEYVDEVYSTNADLMSGILYGSFTTPPGYTTNFPVSISLTAAALADINASLGGFFALGIGPGETWPGFIPPESGGAYFRGGRLDLTTVVNPVPEPASILLLTGGLFTIGIRRRCKRLLSRT